MLFLRSIKESILFALEALRVNKLRTILSLLGVTIGIFLIISVFTVVDTMESKIRTSVQKLGDNVVYIQKWPWGGFGDYPWWDYFQRPVPTLEEHQKLSDRLQTAEASTFNVGIGDRMLEFGTNTVEGVDIIGTTFQFDKVRDLEFSGGRYFTNMEMAKGSNVAIIGATIADGLFGSVDPIGKEIKAAGRQVTVIGTLVKEGDDMFGNTTDEWVIVPVNFARNLVNIRSESSNPDIWVKGKEGVGAAEVEAELRGVMRSIRKLSPGETDDFALNRNDIVAQQLEPVFAIVNFAGWVIGLFSILVGGFGIANIMFVSVKERTNIIGIQKSLGAKNYFVLSQFLVESIALCLIGGTIGLFLVFMLTLVFSSLTGTAVVLSAWNITLGLLISVIIGIVAGYWPAYSAAKLDPVEAIRSGF
ncbi:putative ABC transport system permease protein [Anseongella ginsenosidimutans]|uniref:Putative ABC transport system permease protein n=1 Tax=Anseongella ginsenosidimutans TaxID=496056 RepID=A0A4R3KN30_9SPHI|nr:ABC transporter permease [Anseongella ginsenosidimutans]QEC52759.1 FtsX-like permease family protein [Anseongella ginsenosidimutans]TCS85517.1 putative ABC transport system permease protein [Anseongella ginsenosidimutans]